MVVVRLAVATRAAWREPTASTVTTRWRGRSCSVWGHRVPRAFHRPPRLCLALMSSGSRGCRCHIRLPRLPLPLRPRRRAARTAAAAQLSNRCRPHGEGRTRWRPLPRRAPHRQRPLSGRRRPPGSVLDRRTHAVGATSRPALVRRRHPRSRGSRWISQRRATVPLLVCGALWALPQGGHLTEHQQQRRRRCPPSPTLLPP